MIYIYYVSYIKIMSPFKMDRVFPLTQEKI